MQEFGAHELMEGVYASESTLHSSVAFLRSTLAGLGFCQDLNLMSSEPADVVSTCNTIYGLLLQHQKDCKFREQLKQGAQATGPPASCQQSLATPGQTPLRWQLFVERGSFWGLVRQACLLPAALERVLACILCSVPRVGFSRTAERRRHMWSMACVPSTHAGLLSCCLPCIVMGRFLPAILPNPADMHRLRLDMGVADKERGRLETRLAAKEREIGGLSNKVCAALKLCVAFLLRHQGWGMRHCGLSHALPFAAMLVLEFRLC